MTLRETPSPLTRLDTRGLPLRDLGAFENLFDLYAQQNPVRFSVIAELDRVVPAEAVVTALAALQRSQPLLAVGIDRSASPGRFVSTTRAIPLVVAPSGTPWDTIAATDQALPLGQVETPLARCTLSWTATSTFLVLTLSHQIADGLSGTAALRELVRALNGEHLDERALPESQEDALRAAASLERPAVDTTPIDVDADSRIAAQDDSRMGRRGTVRPFDDARPDIESTVWSAELTARARAAARAESTTLHGLITAATVRVLLERTDRDFLALMNPMDTRQATGTDDTLALRFLSARLGFDAHGIRDIWPLARGIRGRLREAQQLPVLAAMAEGFSHALPADPTVADAVEAMVSFANYDLMATNLGDLGWRETASEQDPARVRIIDLFGPTMATQIEGEYVLGVSTFDGRLRTTVTTRQPIAHFVSSIRDEVEAAVALSEDRRATR